MWIIINNIDQMSVNLMHDHLYLLLDIGRDNLSNGIDCLNRKVMRIDIEDKELLILYKDSRKRRKNNADNYK